ncbi:unnamed protein product [Amoebophrya sp. A25]|nr:unnamed protein product [Amoebophrya sp. A25]|eukprot:GSA25T00005143001.1
MQEWSTNYRRKYPKARIAEPSDGNEALTSVLGPMEKEPTPVDLSVYIPQPRTLLEVAPIPATSTRAPSEPEVIHASKDSAGVHLAKKDIRSFLNGMLTRGDPGRCALLEKNAIGSELGSTWTHCGGSPRGLVGV